jgi:DNA polymerase-3 subunit epsilon
MQKGDFPLYTKRCLEKIWIRWNGKKERLKVETQTKISLEPRTKPQERTATAAPRVKEEVKPINTDMLEQLKMKFGK